MKPGIVPEGLGLVATRDISRNDVVLEVPKKFWINPDAAAASEIGSICSGLKPWISVALFLLRERFKGEESKWKYYFDVLPESTDSTIYWWGYVKFILVCCYCFIYSVPSSFIFMFLFCFDKCCFVFHSSAGQKRSFLRFKVSILIRPPILIIKIEAFLQLESSICLCQACWHRILEFKLKLSDQNN